MQNAESYILNAETPVGAVSSTVTSSCNVPDSFRNLSVSEWITWDLPTPPGPLRNT